MSMGKAMGILDRILANKPLTLANKLAPVISSSILCAYVMSDKKLSIVVGNDNQQAVLDKHQELRARADKAFNLGGG